MRKPEYLFNNSFHHSLRVALWMLISQKLQSAPVVERSENSLKQRDAGSHSHVLKLSTEDSNVSQGDMDEVTTSARDNHFGLFISPTYIKLVLE